MEEPGKTLSGRTVDEWTKEELFETCLTLKTNLDSLQKASQEQQKRIGELREEIEKIIIPIRYHQGNF
jgi:chaperonin cofactor prefoldin